MTTAPVLLAAEDSNKAGPIGLLVIILLGIACYFLYRSMSRHLRRVREQFPGRDEPTPAEPSHQVDESTVSTQQEVDASTPEQPRTRFVPPVRPTHAVTRPDDDRAAPGQE